jgi:murein DD-endopeptidase MepM/ murein hydrolase activator NlpD
MEAPGMPTVFQGLPPMFLAAAAFFSPDAEPVERAEAVVEPAVVEEVVTVEEPVFEVVASSPLPASYGMGSDFGYRLSGRTGRRTFHAGIDFGAERGTPVYAVRRGVVETVASERVRANFTGYGNAIVVHHADDARWSFYAHLDEVLVEQGQVVEPGMLIGRVGNTTNRHFPGMGTHLHFEVRVAQPDGTSPFPGPYRRHNIDPAAWLTELGVHIERGLGHDCESHGEDPLLVVAAADPVL